MNKKIIVGVLALGILVCCAVAFMPQETITIVDIPATKLNSMEVSYMDQYQGPVPEGYDEQFFRETGITQPLEAK